MQSKTRMYYHVKLKGWLCVLQVKMVLEKLYENKKIASATHNIYAYRSVIAYRVRTYNVLWFIMQIMLTCVSIYLG